MKDSQKKFIELFPKGKIDENLSTYSTFKIGGPSDFFYKLNDHTELPALIEFAKENSIPHRMIGSGSNILFDDEGFRGLIIKITEENITINETEISASAGTSISKLIKASIEAGLTGLERWTGLPGTVGGAVRGNAGYNGLETKDMLTSTILFDPKTGKTRKVSPDYLEFGYRTSKIKETEEIVLAATFQLKESKLSPTEQEEIINESRSFRINKQPPGFTTGSFFKNPSPDKPAGLLIDQAGLKGHEIGKAQISPKHANFFMNTGGATSKDVLALASLAKKEVQAKFGINLEEEVQIISP